MEFDVSKIRKDFPMLNNKKMQGKDLIYFDNAATSLKPQSVINAVVDYYSNYCANAHRGDYDIAHHVDEEYDKVRIKVSKLINSEPNEVVFTSGTSMSINLVAYGYGMSFLTKDDEILITEAEHASNVLPWYNVSEATGCKVSFIELDDEGRVTLDNLKKALNPHVKIVSLAQVSNVLGFDIDIKAFANEFKTLSIGQLDYLLDLIYDLSFDTSKNSKWSLLRKFFFTDKLPKKLGDLVKEIDKNLNQHGINLLKTALQSQENRDWVIGWLDELVDNYDGKKRVNLTDPES